MRQIGILSDTHGTFDESLEKFFEPCDELWHAGDIGNLEIAHKMEKFKLLKAVSGNIDDYKVRSIYKPLLRFNCEDVDVMITHIGGYPGRWEPEIKKIFELNAPKLFICGHSHICKVIFDKQYNMLHINPGAAGCSGFHAVRTAIRLKIDNKQIKDVEVWEKKRN